MTRYYYQRRFSFFWSSGPKVGVLILILLLLVAALPPRAFHAPASAATTSEPIRIADIVDDAVDGRRGAADDGSLGGGGGDETIRPSPVATGTTVTMTEAFEAFIVQYKRPYGVSSSDRTGGNGTEKAKRRLLFEKNVKRARELQRIADTFTLKSNCSLKDAVVYAITQFADQDLEALHELRRKSFAKIVSQNLDLEEMGGGEGGVSKSKTFAAAATDDDDREEGDHHYDYEAYSDELNALLKSKKRRFTSIDSLIETTIDADGNIVKRPTAAQRYRSRFAFDIDNRKWQKKHAEEARINEHAADENGVADPPRHMDSAQVPTVLDWRTLDAVTPVKDQADCGSCWSFSVTGNVESQWIINGHEPTLLSEQELLSCDYGYDTNDACNGGLMDVAFLWILTYRGGYLSRADTYPFTSGNGLTARCDMNKSTPGAQIYRAVYIPSSENDLMQAVGVIGPACVGVDANGWEFYRGGIIQTCSNRELDHAVIVVGYDSTSELPYWIVKNSWKASWGEDGYIRLAMGINACGIKDYITTGLVSADPITLPRVGPPLAAPPPRPDNGVGTPLAASVITSMLTVGVVLLANTMFQLSVANIGHRILKCD